MANVLAGCRDSGSAMSPAEQPSTKPDDSFTILHRERAAYRVTQVRSSGSQLDALRARIRSQSKKVEAYIQASPQAQEFIAEWGSPDSPETCCPCRRGLRLSRATPQPDSAAPLPVRLQQPLQEFGEGFHRSQRQPRPRREDRQQLLPVPGCGTGRSFVAPCVKASPSVFPMI
jgi:hypothetical protein